MSFQELYGRFDELTLLWTDGLASSLLREAASAADSKAVHRWTVFDGPIDSKWIENMNTVLSPCKHLPSLARGVTDVHCSCTVVATLSLPGQVLDDNMMLCLSNGERIRLDPTMRLLFEVSDLESASPATVSRLGVVYMAPDTVGWLPFVQSWLQSPHVVSSTTPDVRERLLNRFNGVVKPLLAAVKKSLFKGQAPLSDMELIARCVVGAVALCSGKYHETAYTAH